MKSKLSKKDVEDIARLLDAIAINDTISIINSGCLLIDHHPELEDALTYIEWWKG